MPMLILKSVQLSIAILFPLTFSRIKFYCFMVHFYISMVKWDNMKPVEKALVKGVGEVYIFSSKIFVLVCISFIDRKMYHSSISLLKNCPLNDISIFFGL